MSEIILYDYWRSSASYRLRIALNLAGIAYTAVPVDLAKGEHRSEEHLARNPQGLVPVLDIDGLRLTQSLAILDYLDQTRGLGLVPADPAGRAKVQALPCHARRHVDEDVRAKGWHWHTLRNTGNLVPAMGALELRPHQADHVQPVLP